MRRGFTLVEVVIAMGIIAVIISAIYSFRIYYSKLLNSQIVLNEGKDLATKVLVFSTYDEFTEDPDVVELQGFLTDENPVFKKMQSSNSLTATYRKKRTTIIIKDNKKYFNTVVQCQLQIKRDKREIIHKFDIPISVVVGSEGIINGGWQGSGGSGENPSFVYKSEGF